MLDTHGIIIGIMKLIRQIMKLGRLADISQDIAQVFFAAFVVENVFHGLSSGAYLLSGSVLSAIF